MAVQQSLPPKRFDFPPKAVRLSLTGRTNALAQEEVMGDSYEGKDTFRIRVSEIVEARRSRKNAKRKGSASLNITIRSALSNK